MRIISKTITLISFLILCSSLQLNAQTYNSTCTASDSILDLYQFDAEVIALETMQSSNYYTDSILIPQSLRDSILESLIAVRSAINIPNKEFVSEYHIDRGGYSIKNMNMFSVVVDTSSYWAKNLYVNETVSNNSTVDSLIQNYGFRVENMFKFSDIIMFDFYSESNCNIRAAKDFISDVEDIEEIQDPPVPLGYVQWNNYMTLDTYDDSTIVDFVTRDNVYGNHKHRVFKVYNNCSVEILEYNSTSINYTNDNSSPYCYPNPFSNKLTININEESIITIYNLNSTIIYQSKTDSSIDINTNQFKKGTYILEILRGENKSATLIIKL